MCLKSVLRNHRGFVTQGVTQSNFTQTKSVVSVTQKHITTLLISQAIRLKKRYLGVAQLVARYLGVVEPASSSLASQPPHSAFSEVLTILPIYDTILL